MHQRDEVSIGGPGAGDLAVSFEARGAAQCGADAFLHRLCRPAMDEREAGQGGVEVAAVEGFVEGTDESLGLRALGHGDLLRDGLLSDGLLSDGLLSDERGCTAQHQQQTRSGTEPDRAHSPLPAIPAARRVRPSSGRKSSSSPAGCAL